MTLLADHVLEELQSTAMEAGLASAERRPLLLRNMPKNFAANLPSLSRPKDQLLSDLEELNCVTEIPGLESPPLVTWLNNAIGLSSSTQFERVFLRLREGLQPKPVERARADPNQDFLELKSRRELVQTSLSLLVRPSQSFRATIVGPLFLHPPWYVERRNRKIQLPNYDVTLAEYVRTRALSRTHEIRLIFTLSERYRTKVEAYVKPQERRMFQESLLEAIEGLWGSSGNRGPDICCVHPGFLHIQSIYDTAVITTYRVSPTSPIGGGLISYRDDAIERERARFDNVFDSCSNGQEEELKKLMAHVKKLW